MSRICLALLLTAACGTSSLDSRGAETDLSAAADGIAAAPTKVEKYYAIRPDPRLCPSPMCGGYFLRELNASSVAEQYVSELDFHPSGLEQKQIDLVLGTEPVRVILRGALGPGDQGTQLLLVTGAFIGMPNVQPAVDTVFSVRVLPIDCATCPTLRATRVNTTKEESAHTLTVKRAARPYVQLDWLEGRVLGAGALVSASIGSPGSVTASAGAAITIDASQVWLQLPDQRSCPAVKPAPCENDAVVRTFMRDADRCVLPDACVKPGACPLFFPACEAGYRLVSWPAAPNGCDAFACDPEFVSP